MSIATIRTAALPREKLFTIADVARLPTELPSGTVDYELDNGRLIPLAPSTVARSAAFTIMGAELLLQGQRQGFGQARLRIGIILWRNPDRLVAADAAFILNRSLPIRESKEGYLETIPELIVEVRSKNNSTKEVEDKVSDYLTAGVWKVLVMDPATKTITVHHPTGEPRVFKESETLTLEGILPEFRCAVAELFR